MYDLSAAYDTISPKILIEKAEHYGFDKTSISWLTSFTTGRSQAVKMGTKISELQDLVSGIPQGSPLSCVLFLIYVQDLPAWINEGHIQGYADDTLHFLSANTPEEVIEKLETGSKEILTYFASNELVANSTKTYFIMPTKLCGGEFTVNIDRDVIRESKSERILGFQVQKSLEWQEHIKKSSPKQTRAWLLLDRLQDYYEKKPSKYWQMDLSCPIWDMAWVFTCPAISN